MRFTGVPVSRGSCYAATMLMFGMAMATTGIVAQAGVPRLSVREELRIRGADAELSPVTWLAAARNGDIYVSQQQDAQIRIFDRDGHSVGTVGRAGSGPREFAALGASGWTGDSLWIFDPSLERLTFLRSDRTLGESVRSPRIEGGTPGGVPGYGGIAGTSIRAFRADGAAILMSPLSRLPGSTVPRVIAYFLLERNAGHRLVATGVPFDCFKVVGAVSVVEPLCPEPLSAAMQDGRSVVLVDHHGKEGARVRSVRSDGTLAFERVVVMPRVPVSAGVWDSIIEARTRGPSGSTAIGLAIKTLKAPEYFPWVRTLLLARDGAVWLEGWGKGARPWTVLRPDGKVRGTVTLPAGFRLMAVDGDLLWGTALDADDFPEVVRYRIVR